MKMAKVSPIYEGKLRKRSVEGEEDEEEGRSRRARIDAKARRRNFRMNHRAAPPLYVPSNARTIIASTSMASSSSSSEQEDENPDIMKNTEDLEKQNQDDVVISVEEKECIKEVINIEDDIEQKETKKAISNEEHEQKEEKEEKIEKERAGEPGMEKWENGCFVGVLEEWPMMWSYEEEWLWWGRAPLALRCLSWWEYISGVGWIEKPAESN